MMVRTVRAKVPASCRAAVASAIVEKCGRVCFTSDQPLASYPDLATALEGIEVEDGNPLENREEVAFSLRGDSSYEMWEDGDGCVFTATVPEDKAQAVADWMRSIGDLTVEVGGPKRW